MSVEVEAGEWTTATMVHCLKTPITVVKSAIEVIFLQGEEIKPEVLKSLLSTISQSFDELDHLIDQNLAILKGEAKQWESNCSPCNLTESVHEILNSFRPVYDVKCDATLTSPVAVWSDVRILKTVLHHLLENSFRYGTGRVSMNFGIGPSLAGIHITNEVDDPTVLTDEIFSPGNRGTHEWGEGTGLGLYIARAHTRSMGGEITVTQCGYSVTFTVWLSRLTEPLGWGIRPKESWGSEKKSWGTENTGSAGALVAQS